MTKTTKDLLGDKITNVLGESDLRLESILMPDETLVAVGRVHWAIYWQSVAVLIFAFFVSLMAVELGILFGIVGVLMLIHSVQTKHFLLLALTDKRVLTRYGLLQMEVVDMRFSKVESIELERMLPGVLLGYANVVIMGVGQRYFRIPYIDNAVDFRRAYNEIVLQYEGTAKS